MSLEPLIFDDPAPIEEPVKIGPVSYILREASEDAACKYRNALMKGTKLGPDGKPSSIEGMADAEPLLVSLCLFTTDKDGRLPLLQNGNPDPRYSVRVETVRGWKGRIVKPLYDRIKAISLLDEPETAEALQKQITALQEKLDALNGSNGQANPGKNLPESAEPTSG